MLRLRLLVAGVVLGIAALILVSHLTQTSSPGLRGQPGVTHREPVGHVGLSGAPVVGQLLTSTTGTWTNCGTGPGYASCSFAYEWEDCNTGGGSCSNISGATSATYTVQSSDVGDTLRVKVTATNSGGSTTSTSAATLTAVAAAAFTAGVCSPSCTPASYVTYKLDASTGDTSTYDSQSTGTAATVAQTVEIERPNNLVNSSGDPTPLVICACGHNTSTADWQGYAPLAPYLLVYIPTPGSGGNPGCGGGASYCEPTISRYGSIENSEVSTSGTGCSSTGTVVCDSLPLFQAVIQDLETCSGASSTGTWSGDAPPCEHVNPAEVYATGGSSGSDMVQDLACDTRTSSELAGISAISGSLYSANVNSLDQNPENCPALLGVNATYCNADCITTTPNTSLSLQWVYGTDDLGYNGPSSWGQQPATGDCSTQDCLDNGILYTTIGGNANPGDGGDEWLLPVPALAHTVTGTVSGGEGAAAGTPLCGAACSLGNALGCSSSGSGSSQAGNTGGQLIETTTWTGCTNPGAATQTVVVTGGGHLLYTWPCQTSTSSAAYNALSGDDCDASGYSGDTTDNVASDGLADPVAAWSFWTTHFP